MVTASSQTQSVTLSASSAKANRFPFGTGSINPAGYSMVPTPQYPLPQSSTQQPTVTHVYTWHLSSVLPQQSVSYVMPAQSYVSQANDLMRRKESRQEFVPIIGPYVDVGLVEPLHNANNAWQLITEPY